MANQKSKAILPNEGWKIVRLNACNGPGSHSVERSVFAEDFGDILKRPRSIHVKVPLYYPGKEEEGWPKHLGSHFEIPTRMVVTGCERLDQDTAKLTGFLLPGSAMLSLLYSPEDPLPPCISLEPSLKISVVSSIQYRVGTAHLPVCAYLELLEQGRLKGYWL